MTAMTNSRVDDLPDWLQPGSEVAVYDKRMSARTLPRVTTVERVTKTLVVLSSGSRLPRRGITAGTERLEFQAGSGTWNVNYFVVLPPSSPEFLEVVAHVRAARSVGIYEKTPSPATARTAATALLAWADAAETAKQ